MSGPDTRPAWLASLRPGDEVAVCEGWREPRFIHLGKVARRTPSGRIVLEGGKQYDPEGAAIPKASGLHGRRLHPLTGPVKDAADHERLVSTFRHVTRWESLPVEKLRAVHRVLLEEPTP